MPRLVFFRSRLNSNFLMNILVPPYWDFPSYNDKSIIIIITPKGTVCVLIFLLLGCIILLKNDNHYFNFSIATRICSNLEGTS